MKLPSTILFLLLALPLLAAPGDVPLQQRDALNVSRQITVPAATNGLFWFDGTGVLTSSTEPTISGLVLNTTGSGIRTDTLNAADNKSISINGGGGYGSPARGSYISVYGNESGASPGRVLIAGGSVSTGNIEMNVSPFGSARFSMIFEASSGELGVGELAPLAKLHVIETTEQQRLGYDASNYVSTTVSSTGGVTLNAVGAGSAFTFSDPVNVTGAITQSGTAVQLADAELTALAGLTSAADSFPYYTGSGTAALLPINSTIRGILDETTIAAFDTAIGLGTGDSPTFSNLTLGSTTATLTMQGTTNSALITNSSDGTDTKSITIGSAGALGTGRGASITVYGNEVATQGGQVYLAAGNNAAVTGDITMLVAPYTAATTAVFEMTSGELGVGVVDPLAKLHVVSTTSPQARIAYDASNHVTIGSSSAGAITYDATGASASHSFSDTVINTLPMRLKNYTVATLPAGVQGDTAFVTDALAPTYLGALVGGGAVVCPVFYNGAAWVSH